MKKANPAIVQLFKEPYEAANKRLLMCKNLYFMLVREKNKFQNNILNIDTCYFISTGWAWYFAFDFSEQLANIFNFKIIY